MDLKKVIQGLINGQDAQAEQDAHQYFVKKLKDLVVQAKINEAVEIAGANQYEYANGHKPSGPGTWIFAPMKTIDFTKHRAGEDYFQSKAGTQYSEAKKQAKAWAKEHKHTLLYVQS
jgi:hypothetical protein